MIHAPSIQRKAKNIIFTSSRFARGLFSGYYRSIFKGPGIEIEEVRSYQPGDDVKSIDWNVSARKGTLHTKCFREERELPVFIVFDISSSMEFGTEVYTKREQGALAAAALSYAAVYNSDRIGGVLFSDIVEKWIRPSRGTTQAAKCVKNFLEYPARNKGSDINEVLQTVATKAVHRGICFLISDFKFPLDYLRVWRLQRRQDLVALRIIDPLEYTFAQGGLIEIKDLETAKSDFFRSPVSNKEYYRKQAETFQKNKLDYVDIFTNEDPLEQLYLFFKRRARQ